MYSDFLFNATTIQGQLESEDTNDWDEYRYLLPADYLNIVLFNSPENYPVRFEGEYFYSKDKEVKLTYCREISILNYPNYLKNYLVYRLAYELARTYTGYEEKLPLMNQEMGVAKRKIEKQEDLGFVIDNTPYRTKSKNDRFATNR